MLLIAIIILAICCAVSAAVIAATTIGGRAQRGANRDVRQEGWEERSEPEAQPPGLGA